LKVYLRYTDAGQVDLQDFDSISEKYESLENRYVVGLINLARLREVSWLKNPEVNILVMD